ncbi:MAG: tetratricopeptide repeat protein [Wenzhouxiangella sp.]
MVIQGTFIVIAGLAVLAGLLFALWPEIRARLKPGAPATPTLPRPVSLAILALLPLVTAVLYLQFGTYGEAEVDDPRITLLRSQMIEKARSLERNPDQPEQWQRLGLIYKDLQDYGPAEHTLRRALYLRPDSAFLHVELAEVLNQRNALPGMPAEARQLLERAVTLEPDNLKALWLLATDDFLAGNYQTALAWWEQMLPLVPEDSSMHRAIRSETRRARRLIEQQP